MFDELDLKLVGELQKDGRESHVDLAKKLDVVEGTVRKRIKQLLGRGIIKIVAVPDLAEFGYKFTSVIGLQVRMENLREVAENLAQKQQICYLAFVTGRYDLLAIIVTKSPKELSLFLEKEISGIPSVLRTETFVTLDIIKGSSSMTDTSQIIRDLEVSR